MKNFIKIIISFVFLFTVAAQAENVEIKVGATARPHAEILDFVKPMLAKKGIDLKIVIFQDYILPNKALDNGDLDANFYQHIQFLEEQMRTAGYKFEVLARVHIEPMGIYSKKYKHIADVKAGSSLIMSNSVADRTRTLLLLEKAGLITFKDGVNKSVVDFNDIKSAKVEFKPEVDPAILSRMYLSDEADLVVINTNYAIEAGINPLSDALVLEDKNSPYVNVLVSRADNANNPALLELAKALTSEETKKFIIDTYRGAVIPAK
ncbi:MAG: methionine ABC transporter substrate-binding protein [Alphaproteobacteria bacterium]|jgi:D-methionine transport system substrate-binding protein|nr:methionine ABC transporter substrate-binding protein [Alphaproteobacteria bacterium]